MWIRIIVENLLVSEIIRALTEKLVERKSDTSRGIGKMCGASLPYFFIIHQCLREERRGKQSVQARVAK